MYGYPQTSSELVSYGSTLGSISIAYGLYPFLSSPSSNGDAPTLMVPTGSTSVCTDGDNSWGNFTARTVWITKPAPVLFSRLTKIK